MPGFDGTGPGGMGPMTGGGRGFCVLPSQVKRPLSSVSNRPNYAFNNYYGFGFGRARGGRGGRGSRRWW
jgi:hypothetical protein